MIGARYRLETQIGNGGMGTVWVAFDTQLHRNVAVKLMRAGQHDVPMLRNRFANEARAIAQIQHPNVVQIFDYGVDSSIGQRGEETPYIVMEFLIGENLESRISRLGRLPLSAVANLVAQAARGLGTAHAAGIIHRGLLSDRNRQRDRGDRNRREALGNRSCIAQRAGASR